MRRLFVFAFITAALTLTGSKCGISLSECPVPANPPLSSATVAPLPPPAGSKPECNSITDTKAPIKTAAYKKRPDPIDSAPSDWNASCGTVTTAVGGTTPPAAIDLAVATNGSGRTIKVVHGDLVKEKTDAIVNAANASIGPGGGVTGAIYSAAGPQFATEAKNYNTCHGNLDPGSAALTKGGTLPAKNVVHVLGPVPKTRGSSSAVEDDQLYSAYYNGLAKADEFKLASISFPSVSTGIFGFPVKRGAELAFQAVFEYFADNPGSTLKEVRFINIDPTDKNSPTPKQFLTEFRRLFNAV